MPLMSSSRAVTRAVSSRVRVHSPLTRTAMRPVEAETRLPWAAPYRGAHGGAGAPSASDAEAFMRVVHSRTSTRAFDASRDVPDDVLRSVLEATLRTPTGFNMQPYRVVVARDAAVRRRLSEAMLGASNAERVRTAPVVAVFGADLDAVAGVEEIIEMEARAGLAPPAYLRALRTSVAVFAGGGGGAAPGAGSVGACGAGAATALGALGAVASALTGFAVPDARGAGVAWAYKNAALAAGTYLLAAHARGLATSPMEGLDPRKAALAVGLPPERYAVALVVATGHARAPAEGAQGAGAGAKQRAQRSPRLPPGRVFSLDAFGAPFPGMGVGWEDCGQR